ncbi:glucose-1-phosphate thymidylyltransferase [Streptomyces sp. MUM 203J]|uniref:glucose-1-phosphate thymidylyltransferase n=1 Tax=Streptomyces sp. MUM 203J TaxID=2791990 RepID=UPI001F033978|nr:glucose-1-phosphate thymidylyltransferase [Streptomyces sp. MUM 203J]MCH0542313.1 glucose-1-phosphate thymidylyltransferase [Streptomyces sp. MUM 203J]
MKALVLSGGAGTRLRPLSYSMPKQLVPIANKPVLAHVLQNIKDLGVKEIGVIVGDWAPEIADVMGDGAQCGTRVTYIRQDQPRGLAHCVEIARDFLGDDDFVMYLGDNMLPDGITSIAEEFRANRPTAQVVVHKVPDPRAFGVVELDAEGGVERLVEKPRQPRSDLALIGVYFFTPAIHEAVASIEPSARGELEITDAIQWLVENGADVRASEYDGYWKDTGNVDDVLECNAHLLDRMDAHIAGEVDEHSVVDDQVVVGAGARIVRSRVRGPAIIAENTVVEDSDIGPYTSIGRDCELRSSTVSGSIVLDRARISHVRNLRDSLIGRDATVGTGELNVPHHRLVVGDFTRVEVAA